MFVLGINISHHPSICLIEDGEVIYYLEEDRLNKFNIEELKLDDPMISLTHLRKYTTHIDHLIFSSYVKGKWHSLNDKAMMGMAKERLSLYGITYDEVYYEEEHHLWHATNAFYSSTFDEAGALICDGGGKPFRQWVGAMSREVESMYYFSGTTIDTLHQVYGSNDVTFPSEAIGIDDKTIISSTLSNAWIFDTISWCCRLSTAGKVMGLSPYGVAEKASTDEWFKLDEETGIWITHNENILNTLRGCFDLPNFDPMFDKETEDPPPFSFERASNICQKAQEETRKHTIRLIRDLLGRVNTKNVVLSGGYFLNCVNNYHYIKEFPGINFYIDPCAHDGGTSMGAAFYVWHYILKNKKRHPLKTLFLG